MDRKFENPALKNFALNKKPPTMKNYLLLLGILLFTITAHAQLTLGVKGGINTTSISPEELEILNLDDAQKFGISVKDADYGMHFGLFVQGQMGKFIFRPEFIFNSNKINYNVKEFGISTIAETVKSETYQYLDIPVMMGAKLGALRLMAGPVGHIFIHSKSELKDLSGYSQKFNDMTYGYQLGLGLDAGRLSIDGRYEGNFNKASDHFTFFNHNYHFSTSPSRFIVSLGFRF